MKRALIVDDSALMRHVQRRVLKKLGWDVHDASTASEGLQALHSLGQCDLLLTDWHMPGMDGMAFISQVRRDRRFAEMRIVLVTSDCVHDSVERAVAAGANDVLMKPFTPESFEERVAEVMGG